ncbi:hypothetical protein FQA39_LY16088 [Lamprigera yunnana]|nr:hypothetical protein FQA39_LY16088 [Lamprigera yunnana]
MGENADEKYYVFRVVNIALTYLIVSLYLYVTFYNIIACDAIHDCLFWCHDATPLIHTGGYNLSVCIHNKKFINAILQHPYLFDKSETKFKNISLKDTTWRNVGELFCLSCEDAKKYFKTLREKYFRVKRESEKESRSGSGAVTKEKWHLFELLRFLDEVSKPIRKTIANTVKEAVSKLQYSMDVYTVPVDEADAVYSEVIEVNSPSEIFLDVDDTITVEEISNSSLPSCSSDKRSWSRMLEMPNDIWEDFKDEKTVESTKAASTSSTSSDRKVNHSVTEEGPDLNLALLNANRIIYDLRNLLSSYKFRKEDFEANEKKLCFLQAYLMVFFN